MDSKEQCSARAGLCLSVSHHFTVSISQVRNVPARHDRSAQIEDHYACHPIDFAVARLTTVWADVKTNSDPIVIQPDNESIANDLTSTLVRVSLKEIARQTTGRQRNVKVGFRPDRWLCLRATKEEPTC
ncbi:MAG: hypothetical protein M3O31_02385 [Acidobacteriota bacterium]|nr:hypothetical protein [Acidobacteriota bacterium]